ncbi:hypothetical protein EVAR_12328_1 [Eumeta japonica]|uniref:Uncharacterized protein n=1 Tax=Eumeta variegata TaxID=151549 RepID=A0A4C1ZVW2_EUMVA|nr:hypothetical protein EVAR_12328_1 [Eumeta japonica]
MASKRAFKYLLPTCKALRCPLLDSSVFYKYSVNGSPAFCTEQILVTLVKLSARRTYAARRGFRNLRPPLDRRGGLQVARSEIKGLREGFASSTTVTMHQSDECDIEPTARAVRVLTGRTFDCQ